METTRARSAAKALSWRTLASLDTFVLGYLITGEPIAAASIAGGEVLTKMVLYYFHERGWAAIKWGHSGHTAGFDPALAPRTNYKRMRHTL
jgi:uncharacterized membrane protein